MPFGVGFNPYASNQVYPGAAEKGMQDPRKLEKQANAQLETRNAREAQAVASRQKPVQGNEESDRAQARKTSDQAARPEKGSTLSVYA